MPPPADEDGDADLSTDAPSTVAPAADADANSSSSLQQLLARERAAHAETSKDLQVERAAHDETAEKMVQLQQRLEVTLQELANLERFTKRQQTVAAAPGTVPQVERLLKEESYLKSRLLFVQQARTPPTSRARRAGPREWRWPGHRRSSAQRVGAHIPCRSIPRHRSLRTRAVQSRRRLTTPTIARRARSPSDAWPYWRDVSRVRSRVVNARELSLFRAERALRRACVCVCGRAAV